MKKAFQRLGSRLLPPHPTRRMGDLKKKTGVPGQHKELDFFLREVNGTVLDLGSGGRRIDEATVSFDLSVGGFVDVIGDGQQLPFKEGIFDGIIIQQVLQYVPSPEKIVCESRRVLKPGGRIFIEIPFIAPRHELRTDYWRWTQDGLVLFANRHFSVTKQGVSMGGGSAISALLRWSARVFATGGERQARNILWWLSWIVMGWLTFWIKYLDQFMKTNPMADMVAAHVFYIGRKNDPF